MKTDKELLDCSHCGGLPMIQKLQGRWWNTKCSSCSAGAGRDYDSEEYAKSDWDRIQMSITSAAAAIGEQQNELSREA
jgi:hypothetical protein